MKKKYLYSYYCVRTLKPQSFGTKESFSNNYRLFEFLRSNDFRSLQFRRCFDSSKRFFQSKPMNGWSNKGFLAYDLQRCNSQIEIKVENSKVNLILKFD